MLKSFFQIRNDKSVRGFKIGNTEVKLTAFADDTTFFVKDEASLRRILKIMSVIASIHLLGLTVRSVRHLGQADLKSLTKNQSTVGGPPW